MTTPKKWTIHSKRADFDALSNTLGIDKVAARILVNRGIEERDMPSFLHPSKNDFNDPHLIIDVDRSISIIREAITSKKQIRIVGDYDIDGICATYILKKCLEKLKAKVDYYLPKRIEDGYGMNEQIVQNAKMDGVSLLITVDNGIAAAPAVDRAKELGLTVIITDHHEIPKDESGNDVIPNADAVIDPKRAECEYPFKEICGAVVAWKLATCLFEDFGVDEKESMEYLEFAAFATVGDIMKLHNENRAIVSLGLKKMMHTKNLGLRTLIECCGLNGKTISTYHVGFVLGPCLNAGGRLSDASLGVELFETEDVDRAYELANYLRELNEERKQMTLDGTTEAITLIEEMGYDNDKIIVVYIPHIHESLCGIIAGRLKEKYTRPCFMLTDGENHVKGSGRSIPEFNMFEEMNRIQDLFLMYGGHPMAAGLSIVRDNVDEFRTKLNSNSHIKDEDLVEKIMIDVAMPLGYISLDLIKELALLEPFGNGNEKPIFARKDIEVYRIQRIGKNSEFLKLTVKDNDTMMTALYFKDANEFCESISSGDTIDIIYYPQINEFKGEESVQIVITDYRASA